MDKVILNITHTHQDVYENLEQNLKILSLFEMEVEEKIADKKKQKIFNIKKVFKNKDDQKCYFYIGNNVILKNKYFCDIYNSISKLNEYREKLKIQIGKTY